jgi:hypothetical protein
MRERFMQKAFSKSLGGLILGDGIESEGQLSE